MAVIVLVVMVMMVVVVVVVLVVAVVVVDGCDVDDGYYLSTVAVVLYNTINKKLLRLLGCMMKGCVVKHS